MAPVPMPRTSGKSLASLGDHDREGDVISGVMLPNGSFGLSIANWEFPAIKTPCWGALLRSSFGAMLPNVEYMQANGVDPSLLPIVSRESVAIEV